MRTLIATALVAASLGLAPGAFAATKPAPTPAAKADLHAKKDACEKTWAAQKTHTGKHAAFMKSCVAKG